MRLFRLFRRFNARANAVAAMPPLAPLASRAAPVRVKARVVQTGPPGPQDLRRLIFAAVASNDSERLATMFRENPEGIVVHADEWMKVPDALRPNPAAVRWYSEGMRAVAQYCVERLNRRDLFERLDELGLSNPVAAVE